MTAEELLNKHSAVLHAALGVYGERMNEAAAEAHLANMPGPSAAFLEAAQQADKALSDLQAYEDGDEE